MFFLGEKSEETFEKNSKTCAIRCAQSQNPLLRDLSTQEGKMFFDGPATSQLKTTQELSNSLTIRELSSPFP